MVTGSGKGTREQCSTGLWGPAGERKRLPTLCTAVGDYGQCLLVATEEGLEVLSPKK